MDISVPTIRFLDFPCELETLSRPAMTVICLRPSVHSQGQLNMNYSEAFEWGLAGLIDYTKPKKDIQDELFAIQDVCARINRTQYKSEAEQLLLAEKYFKMAWCRKDFDCIHAVGTFLMNLPTVQAKKAILRDIRCICDQIECRDCCDHVDAQLTLLELNQHVFVDVA